MTLIDQEYRTAGPCRALPRRTVRLAAALALTIFAGLAVGAAPAQAGEIGVNLYRWQNLGTNLCLADSFANRLQVLGCISHPTQTWEDITPTASTFRFKNKHTQRCLSDSFTNRLQVVDCLNHPTQNWQNVGTGSAFRFKNKHTQRCLSDSLGGGLHVVTCDSSSAYQGWR